MTPKLNTPLLIILPDDPKIADPSLRDRGETFTDHVRRRPSAFVALANRPPSAAGRRSS